VFDGNEASCGKSIPHRPGCAEPIGAFSVIEYDCRRLGELVLYARFSHRGGAYHDASPRLKRLYRSAQSALRWSIN
jgi:hypothetical protein